MLFFEEKVKAPAGRWVKIEDVKFSQMTTYHIGSLRSFGQEECFAADPDDFFVEGNIDTTFPPDKTHRSILTYELKNPSSKIILVGNLYFDLETKYGPLRVKINLWSQEVNIFTSMEHGIQELVSSYQIAAGIEAFFEKHKKKIPQRKLWEIKTSRLKHTVGQAANRKEELIRCAFFKIPQKRFNEENCVLSNCIINPSDTPDQRLYSITLVKDGDVYQLLGPRSICSQWVVLPEHLDSPGDMRVPFEQACEIVDFYHDYMEASTAFFEY